MRFKGIYTPVITPFHEDGSIDWDAYAEIIDNQIKHGIEGIIIGGTTGEVYALTVEERIEQLKFAKDRIKGQAEFMAGVNDLSAATIYTMAQAARDIGADSMLVGAPPYSIPTEAELANHVLRVDKIANLPIMLYNYPGRMGVMMGEEFLSRVAQSSNICGIKESSGDINRLHMFVRHFPQIELCTGADDQVLEFMAWGATSWVSAAGNIFPKECRRLVEVCSVEGNFDKGRRLMKAFLPLMHTLEQGGKFIQCVKYGAQLQGLPSGAGPRPPLLPLKKELKREMDEIIRNVRISVNAILEEKE
ncbi:dihydrodipicolinate synthase family protein [Kiloniella sp. b19]|uniref:dihydrodipicolinate synthase family protein n=1 Tax=Kiloniella sp. GXU_MW_B19 TaxID=3141326 RepID=UPI0031E04EA8